MPEVKFARALELNFVKGTSECFYYFTLLMTLVDQRLVDLVRIALDVA